MEQGSTQNKENLEDHLRNLILSNVTISSHQTNNRASQQGPQQPYRRNHPRASNRDPQNHFNPIQSPQAAGSHVPGLRGGNSGSPHQRNRRSQVQAAAQSHHQASNQVAVAKPVQNAPNFSHSRHNPRPKQSRQPHQEGQSHQAGQTPIDSAMSRPTAQPTQILQRPHINSVPGTKAPGSPITQHPPRLIGFNTQPQYTNQVYENPVMQIQYLDHIASLEVPKVEITPAELAEKEAFRSYLEEICKKALVEGYSGDIATISLVGFGSLSSGFATPGSDMDLAIVPTWKDPSKESTQIDRDIPRLLERAVLDSELGGRLLTKTRVPILKVCQKPNEELYKALYEERKKWDELPEKERYPPPREPTLPPKPLVEVDGQKSPELVQHEDNTHGFATTRKLSIDTQAPNASETTDPKSASVKTEHSPTSTTKSKETNGNNKEPRHYPEKPWLREKALGPLDFPKTGVGIQCDINFENPLGLHNTHLLRCYSLCDGRVRPMVLFVKAWAKRRKINSSYSGTLSSYGYVLMVLHYLVNVAQPPVCPNLQLLWRPHSVPNRFEEALQEIIVEGYIVRFWRNESEIIHAAKSGLLTQNQQSLGALLRGFFHYYASPNHGYMHGPRPHTFFWTNEVLSLRTPGGIRMKQEKGWTGAKTQIMAGKEVRHRYLFAIEDPFELEHNVARTVTHNGIVAIRDEFRRAWRIISAVGKGMRPEGGLFDEIIEVAPPTPKPVIEEMKEVSIDTVSIEGEDNDKEV
ncbi:PAP/OAS1 substrate-binding domain-containing protein [Zopfia rhizophila CBS 207.26]|uniref:polynucleotide adenylyltransferase n=1 Tax=Zopfia rhizophila CBS 207.26 TaxID=1314779 RepID=A0A6A6DH45_9PEZI|nr:PAP/OAS1 substrate-binding domain-containing protein [Zopfia rhizophila CBS 207.26]